MMMAAFCAIAINSCGEKNPTDDKKPEEPVFPAHKVYPLDAGKSATLSFTANMDWELSIPTTMSNYFYIDDHGVKEYKVSGKAGSVTVTIATIEVKGNYDIQKCPVTLKMGGQSKEIAEVDLLPESRTILIYTADVDSNGSFVTMGSGEYQYGTTDKKELSLSWPKGLSGFMLPIKVASNFAWTIKADYPEWLELSATSSDQAEATILLRGKPESLPLDKAEGVITFYDMQNNVSAGEVKVSIPGCKDIVIVDTDSKDIELNLLGEYKQNGSWNSDGFPFYLTSTLDADVIAVEDNDGVLSYNKDSWVKLRYKYPSGEPTKSVVQDRNYHVAAERNTGAQRQALLLALPGYLLSSLDLSKDLFSADGKSLKAEYQKYNFATVKQNGSDPTAGWSALAPLNTAYTMAVHGAGIVRTPKDDSFFKTLSKKFSTDEIYTLYYNNWYSSDDALLLASKSFSSCEFMTSDASSVDYNGNLSIEYPEEGNSNLFKLKIEYFEDGYDCVAVLKNGSSVVAVIVVRMTELYWPEVEYRDIRFTVYDMVGDDGDPDGTILPQNVVLEEIKSGAVFDEYKSYGIPVWRLVYKTATSEKNAMIYVPPFPLGSSSAIEITPSPAWIKVEGALSESNKPYIHVKMTEQNPEAGNVGRVVLKGGGRPLFVLVCEREFMNQ